MAMDEMELVRGFFSEPAPPEPEVVSAARARLGGRVLPGRFRRPWPIRPPRGQSGRHGYLRVGLPVSVGAAAAAVVTVLATQAPVPVLSVFRLPSGAARSGTAGPGHPAGRGKDRAPSGFVVGPPLLGGVSGGRELPAGWPGRSPIPDRRDR